MTRLSKHHPIKTATKMVTCKRSLAKKKKKNTKWRKPAHLPHPFMIKAWKSSTVHEEQNFSLPMGASQELKLQPSHGRHHTDTLASDFDINGFHLTDDGENASFLPISQKHFKFLQSSTTIPPPIRHSYNFEGNWENFQCGGRRKDLTYFIQNKHRKIKNKKT